MKLMLSEIETPAGAVRLAATERGVCVLYFADGWHKAVQHLKKHFGDVSFENAKDPHGAVSALSRYVEGDMRAIDDVTVDMTGTPFQQRVWAELRLIPAGQTLSYGELARRVNSPDASRAVGAANGSNPVSIIVPCHRVIGSNGKLTGYGGGIERKRWLLDHESAHLGAPRLPF